MKVATANFTNKMITKIFQHGSKCKSAMPTAVSLWHVQCPHDMIIAHLCFFVFFSSEYVVPNYSKLTL